MPVPPVKETEQGGLMGSSLSIIEMDDDSDGVLMELLENEDYDYQEHLVNVLQRMVSR